MQTVKQQLAKHGFKPDSLQRVHDFSYEILQDKDAATEDKAMASRLLITLAKEIVGMNKQIQQNKAKPAQKSVVRAKTKAQRLKLSSITVAAKAG